MLLAILIISSLSLVILFWITIIPRIKKLIQIRRLKRTQKLKKELRNEDQNKLVDNIKHLAEFIDWINKQFPNAKARKQFWRDFQNPKYREDYFIKLYQQLEKKPEITVHEKEEKNEQQNPTENK